MAPADAAQRAPQDERREGGCSQAPSLGPIYCVTVMSWCFQFLLDLLWIPLAAYFKDLQLGLDMLGLAFAANLGVRIVPNVLATRFGVKTDLMCIALGMIGFGVNFVWPEETWAILLMSAGGGLTFVRAHLSVHGKLAAGGSVQGLTLAARWSGAARNLGTMVAFVVPVALYQALGWRAVLATAIAVMCLYLALAASQHRSYAAALQRSPSPTDSPAEQGDFVGEPGLVEEAPRDDIPWIDWVIAGAFCVTELQMNIQAAAVPTTLLELGVSMPLVGGVQALGQLLAMGFLVMLSKGYCTFLQKRPTNLLVSFLGTFVGMGALFVARASGVDGAVYIMLVSLYFFYASAYTAQVTMLECLMGVLDMNNSIFVMGVSEIVGCACSLAGGYLGPALLQRSPSAPFALEAAIALATTLVLGVGLGHRAWDQYIVCQTEAEYGALLAEERRARAVISKALRGLRHLHKRPDSYIGVEQKLRKVRTDSNLSTVDSVGTMASNPDMASRPTTPADGCQGSPQRETASDAAGSGDLRAALLAHPAPVMPDEAATPSPAWSHSGAKSAPLAPVQVGMSTYQARQYKKALISFSLAFVGIDRQDYVVERDPEQPMVLSHVRSKSCRV